MQESIKEHIFFFQHTNAQNKLIYLQDFQDNPWNVFIS